MATAVAPTTTTVTATKSARPMSLTRRGASALVAACVVLFAFTFFVSSTIDGVPLGGRLGMALFCTFWLGGGFGLIAAGSAIADHLHNTPEHH
ncbi:MAG: hypothetical protein R2761_14985 [Acidimicrobiales bacterium]